MEHSCSNDFFAKAFLDPYFSDVTFYVGEWPQSNGQPVDKSKLLRIPAHRCVIASVSPAFERMFANELEDQTELIITDISPANFVNILRYIYTNQVECSKANYSLMLACCRYELSGLFRNIYKAHGLQREDQPFDEEKALFLLTHLEEIRKFEMGKWERLINDMLFFAPRSFWYEKGYKYMCPQAMDLYLDQHLYEDPRDLFELCLLWAKYRCCRATAGSDDHHDERRMEFKPDQLRSTIGDLIFKIPLPLLTLDELRQDVINRGSIFSVDETNQLIKSFSTQGPLVPKGDAFLKRFACWTDFFSYVNVIQIRKSDCRGLTRRLTLSQCFYTDQIHFKPNQSKILTGFQFWYKFCIEKLFSVCLVNDQGQTLFNKRSLKIKSMVDNIWDVNIDPIRLMANCQYTLSVTFVIKQRQLMVVSEFPVQLQDEKSAFALHVHCPVTASNVYVSALRFLRLLRENRKMAEEEEEGSVEHDYEDDDDDDDDDDDSDEIMEEDEEIDDDDDDDHVSDLEFD